MKETITMSSVTSMAKLAQRYEEMVISSDSTSSKQLFVEERVPSLVEDRLLNRAGGVPRQL
ncbi:hypothetical protein QJS10_CPA01g00625 [Acorus calamus]|uniref:Uncharacterized protein n=1 Tax=Acorus calamus TaxID=4465 RepID=A0AAV9FIW7_ACOCL|nr:hypothetical protein QJS10_CPA01g00625 [Acorus calamus]